MDENRKERIIRSIPFHAGEIRSEFRALDRILRSHMITDADLDFLEREIAARREQLEIKDGE